MKPVRTLLVALAIGGLATGCSSSRGPGGTQAAPSAASGSSAPNRPKRRTPIVFVAPRVGDKYIHAFKQQGNRKVYVLRADAEKGEYFGENTGQSTFVNPHITFYGSNGKQLVADAPAGLVVESAKSIRMTGGVHAVSSDGIKLTGDTMTYDGNTEIIHAKGHVIMDSPQGSELRGETLDWNFHTGAVDVAGAH